MLRNELKPLLGEGWKEKFVHRDLWDPDGYGVASFDLGEDREKVLVMNFETEDIMEYFYDDRPDDEWVSSRMGVKINKDYKIITTTGRVRSLFEYNLSCGERYPGLTISSKPIMIHRLVATTFVPNSDPDHFSIVNHKNSDTNNFKKENLEWCDIKWNNQVNNKLPTKDEYKNVYTRLIDRKTLTEEELLKEYPEIVHPAECIVKAIRMKKEWRGSKWDIVNLTLEDYLSRHPLQDDWYQHPTMPNVRANGCGVLEVDGKLKIGYYEKSKYTITIQSRRTYTHRFLMECFIGRELTEKEVVDHITPVTIEDVDNSIYNLRIGTQKDNMNNILTKKKMGTSMKLFNLFGELVHEFDSEKDLVTYLNKTARGIAKGLTFAGYIVINSGYNCSLEDKLRFIYYKFNNSKMPILADAHVGNLVDGDVWHPAETIRKYLNTGMPAPDGFYYQQGDPWNMLYDPENKDIIKKRPEIFWKDRNKNREDN